MPEFRIPVPMRGARIPLIVRVTVSAGEGGSGDPVVYAKAIQERAKEENLGKLWGELGDIARDRYRTNFQVGGDPRWTPLKAVTIAGKIRFLRAHPRRARRARRLFTRPAQKTAEAIAHQPLVKTGALAMSYAEQGARGHVEQVATEGQKPTLVVGSAFTITRAKKGRRPTAKDGRGLRVHELRARGTGKGGSGRTVNLADIHDQGAPKAHIPARPQFPGGEVKEEDLRKTERAAVRFITGET